MNKEGWRKGLEAVEDLLLPAIAFLPWSAVAFIKEKARRPYHKKGQQCWITTIISLNHHRLPILILPRIYMRRKRFVLKQGISRIAEINLEALKTFRIWNWKLCFVRSRNWFSFLLNGKIECFWHQISRGFDKNENEKCSSVSGGFKHPFPFRGASAFVNNCRWFLKWDCCVKLWTCWVSGICKGCSGGFFED